jgi:ferritin-like metal-binding protein YciE
MPAKSLQDLFVEEMRDMYDAEKRLLRALPRMAKAATSGQLQKAFTTHTRETARQVRRLEQVFRSLGERPRGKKCDGIMGILEEGNRAIEELEGPVLDAALIAGAQKVEHYEISAYGTLAYFAKLLRNDRAKDLLGETLDEEKATDAKLSALAKSSVNREALLGAGNGNAAGRGTDLGMMRGMSRMAQTLGIGQQEPSGRRRSTTGRAKRRTSRGRRTQSQATGISGRS